MLNDEYRYKVLKLLDENPELSQRQLAKELGISLGKVNYCLKALIEKGMVKAGNFKSSRNKQAYAYLLTPKGLEDKARVTAKFLRIKLREHKRLQVEIEELKKEVERQATLSIVETSQPLQNESISKGGAKSDQ